MSEDSPLQKPVITLQTSKSNKNQSMNSNKSMQIMSESNQIANSHNHESHCSQSLSSTSETVAVTNISTLSTAVHTPQQLMQNLNLLQAQQPVSQSQSNHINTSNSQKLNAPHHLNTMSQSCRLATHHRNKFHEQQVKWKHIECLTCHEVWPSRTYSKECLRCTRDKNVPKKFSKANNMHPGAVPECLQNLTQVEEMLIARVSPIMYVYRKHGGQRGYKGHVLNLSQDVQSLLDKLPQNVSNLPILILRHLGTNDTYSDFTVNRQKVLSALLWLKQNNPYYRSIEIDYAIIEQLPENDVPREILLDLSQNNDSEDISECMAISSNNSAYNVGSEFDHESDTEMDCTTVTPWNIQDPDNDSADDDDTIDRNCTSFIPVPQQEQTEIESIQSIIQEKSATPLPWPELSKSPINEFTTEGFATMAFPTLFPYGTGDPTTKCRQCSISFSESFKHLISYGETINKKIIWRFATHPRFMYWALNMKQRHHLLSQANVYLKQHPNDAALTLQQLKNMVDTSASEQLLSRLHKYVSKVQGTKQYWYQRSLELKALIQTKGAPTFFWTVSAADTYWPELHVNLLPHDNSQITHSMKVKAVIDMQSTHNRLVLYKTIIRLDQTLAV